jgi:hypothetical protein
MLKSDTDSLKKVKKILPPSKKLILKKIIQKNEMFELNKYFFTNI